MNENPRWPVSFPDFDLRVFYRDKSLVISRLPREGAVEVGRGFYAHREQKFPSVMELGCVTKWVWVKCPLRGGELDAHELEAARIIAENIFTVVGTVDELSADNPHVKELERAGRLLGAEPDWQLESPY